LYKACKGVNEIELLFVYVAEAHPVDEKTAEEGADKPDSEAHQAITRAKDVQHRAESAAKCASGLGLSFPILIDKIDNSTCHAYGAWPAGTAVVDMEGKIALYTHGPWGTRPDLAYEKLKELLVEAQAQQAAEQTPAEPESEESAEQDDNAEQTGPEEEQPTDENAEEADASAEESEATETE
jgi:hypothetical protein